MLFLLPAKPMRWLALIVLATGCELFFDGGRRPERCDLRDEAPVQQQLDPTRLECHALGGTTCDPECGPCPLESQPDVSWGFCGGPCDGLNETACAADDRCRVVKDLDCALSEICITDFRRCAPTDQVVDLSVDCERTTDAQRCSQSPKCLAWHVTEIEGGGGGGGVPVEVFRACTARGGSPGRCWDPVACDQAPPACPANEVPLVRDGCYTGACVPRGKCEPGPTT